MTEKEELQMLRELVKKQKLQLSEKDEIIRRQQIQIENMTQALLHARKKMFGKSSVGTAKTPVHSSTPRCLSAWHWQRQLRPSSYG